ncbi:hypothetical protein SUGI_1057390 [Cryptomeria japonica]|nr:hypothetical protein SUGI_1057390 [Cryptomeria japonica]
MPFRTGIATFICRLKDRRTLQKLGALIESTTKVTGKLSTSQIHPPTLSLLFALAETSLSTKATQSSTLLPPNTDQQTLSTDLQHSAIISGRTQQMPQDTTFVAQLFALCSYLTISILAFRNLCTAL